jgi:putative transposase
MKKTRYSDEQIIGILKEAEAGIPITELCRKYGISDGTYYNWEATYGRMTTSEIKRFRQLEDENRRLKQLLADLTLDNQALKAVISKNG